MEQRTPEEYEALAQQLKADGYNGSVVASKLVRQHGMREDLATAMVSRLFGKRVNPRAGDTTFAVLGGAALATVGAVGTLVLIWVGGADAARGHYFWVGLGFLGAGLSRVIIALVNADDRDDLRTRRD